MSDATAPGRDGRGRLVKGHRLGGRPRGKRAGSVVVAALEASGKTLEDARRMLVESTIKAMGSEDAAERSAARRLAASWLLPKERAIGDAGLFRGAKTGEELFASIAGAMAQGAITPDEAVTAGKVVQALCEAGEWERLRELHERTIREAKAGPVLPAGPDAGPEGDKP